MWQSGTEELGRIRTVAHAAKLAPRPTATETLASILLFDFLKIHILAEVVIFGCFRGPTRRC